MPVSKKVISNSLASTVAAGALILAAAESADAATLEMRLTYGATQLVVGDNSGSGNDIDAATNVIQFQATGGSDDSADAGGFFAVGFTFLDVIGALCTICPDTLQLDLQATNPTARDDPQSPTLLVEVSATDFMLPTALSPWFGEANLTGIPRNATIRTAAWWDPGNALYARTNLLGEKESGSTFGEDFFTTWADVDAPYSMTLEMEFDFTGQTQTMQGQSQARLSAIPVPATLPLLLGAMGLLGFLRARRRG